MSFIDDAISGLVTGGSSAPDAAMGYYDQIPGMVKPYLDPYSKMGMDAATKYSAAADSMLSDPTGFVSKIMDSYYQSPQYKYQAGQASDAAANASAMGGTLGTGFHQNQVADAIQGISSRDMQQFLQNILGVNTMGMDATGNVMNQGYNASKSLADILSGNLRDQGSLAYDSAERRATGASDLIAGGASMLFPGGTFKMPKFF